MDLTVTHTDTKCAKLTVTGTNEVRVKLNRDWDEGHKQVIVDTLSKVASHIINQEITFTVRGKFSPDYPRMIQMKSANKKNPQVFNFNVEEIING